VIRYRHDGADHELRCDSIAGCDGFHGVCRQAVPDGVLTVRQREYPFGWLGILAQVAPSPTS
jgi:p-hydroxybenzoate 3-monooxygenase